MKTLGVALVCVCSALVFAPSSAAEEASSAASYGDPTRITIRGANTFPAKAIKTILFQDLDVVQAISDNPNTIDYLRLLCRKATLGYQSAGFPHVSARIEVAPDAAAQGLTLVIDEGPRFLAGPIEVHGAQTLDTGWLIDQLTPDPEAGAGEKRTKSKSLPLDSAGAPKAQSSKRLHRRSTIAGKARYVR